VTTPGGVPNLPTGALTLDTMSSKLQDMSGTAMKARAVERFPDIMDSSTGLSPASDLTPFGILTRIFSEVNSRIATADPNDIQGPEDLPHLLLDFIEDLPVVGQLVGLLEAILGTYDGDDEVLLAVQEIFGPIRSLVDLLTGGIPIGSLTTEQPNLWPLGTFPADSVSGQGIWVLDSTVSRTVENVPIPGGMLTGSVKVVADSTMKALRGVSTAVAAGRPLAVSVFCKWDSYAGSGSTVRLDLVEYGTVGGADVQIGVVTIASLAPPTSAGGWSELAGTYTAAAGVTKIRPRLVVTDEADSGTIWFDDATAYQSGTIPADWVAGLPEIVQGLIGRIQALLDVIHNALTGDTTLTHSLEDLIAALAAIPFGNITGVGGPANVGESILGLLDNLIGGLTGTPGSGASFADAFNISALVSSLASLGGYAWDVLGIRNNTPVASGLLPNAKSNFPINDINTSLSATAAASLIATYRIGESSPLGVISWLGYGTAGLTAFYVNVWLIDPDTGDWSLVHHSPDIVADIEPGATQQWNFYNLADPLAVVAGEQYGFELVPVGATHHVRGISTTDTIPDHPYAQIVGLAATRNNTDPTAPPSTIAKASVVRSGDVPWIEVGIDTGNSHGSHDPVTVYLTESGSVPIPSWAGFIDGITVGGAGGGRKGALARYGEGGFAGQFAAVTWERGVDFDDSVTSVDFVCGEGGAGGAGVFDGVGGDGEDSTLSITGHTVTAAGGAGGQMLIVLNGRQYGEGPGTYTFNSDPYVGGGNQYTAGAPGASPGGAGAGGSAVTLQNGGAGAPGGGWVKFRQGAIVGGGDIPDTTPPTAPTVELDAATYSSITVTATGSVDP